MLSELAQELYELGKKAIAGDEDALVEFIDLYKDEYVDNAHFADITDAERDILCITFIAGDLCEVNAKTKNDLYDKRNSYTRYGFLQEVKDDKMIEKLGELDKVQVIEEEDDDYDDEGEEE